MNNISTIELIKVIISEEGKIILIYIINKWLLPNKEKQPYLRKILISDSSCS